MKLYEINDAISRLVDKLAVDEDTGEITENTEQIMDELNNLNLERQSILQYLAKLVLNTRAEAAMLKAEEERLKARREKLKGKETQIMKILDRECAGEKTSLGVATFSYRKTSHVEVSDSEQAVRWLKRHKYMDCFRIPAPEVAKVEVKKLINAGTKVPGCTVVDDYSCQLK